MDGDVLTFGYVMLVIVMTVASLAVIGLGARILWRWGSIRDAARGMRPDDARLQHLEQSVDAIAIEVERISEAQRFMVGLLSERPQPLAELAPPAPARDKSLK